MDIGAFVQENRRWLIGCAAGAVVFLIAMSVIDSLYDPTAPGRPVSALRTQQPQRMYTSDQVDQLIEESEALGAERERLTRMLAFERSPAFELQPGTSADDALFEVGRELRQGILTAADERGIEVGDKDVSWDYSAQVDEVRQVLFGLELMDEICKRLFAAHDAVRAADEEALGLRSILQLRTEAQKSGRRPSRRARRGEVSLEDLVEQQRVQFKFEADASTVARFFESCLAPGRTLVLEGVRLQQPELITDPLLVTGNLIGIAFKKEAE